MSFWVNDGLRNNNIYLTNKKGTIIFILIMFFTKAENNKKP